MEVLPATSTTTMFAIAATTTIDRINSTRSLEDHAMHEAQQQQQALSSQSDSFSQAQQSQLQQQQQQQSGFLVLPSRARSRLLSTDAVLTAAESCEDTTTNHSNAPNQQQQQHRTPQQPPRRRRRKRPRASRTNSMETSYITMIPNSPFQSCSSSICTSQQQQMSPPRTAARATAPTSNHHNVTDDIAESSPSPPPPQEVVVVASARIPNGDENHLLRCNDEDDNVLPAAVAQTQAAQQQNDDDDAHSDVSSLSCDSRRRYARQQSNRSKQLKQQQQQQQNYHISHTHNKRHESPETDRCNLFSSAAEDEEAAVEGEGTRGAEQGRQNQECNHDDQEDDEQSLTPSPPPSEIVFFTTVRTTDTVSMPPPPPPPSTHLAVLDTSGPSPAMARPTFGKHAERMLATASTAAAQRLMRGLTLLTPHHHHHATSTGANNNNNNMNYFNKPRRNSTSTSNSSTASLGSTCSAPATITHTMTSPPLTLLSSASSSSATLVVDDADACKFKQQQFQLHKSFSAKVAEHPVSLTASPLRQRACSTSAIPLYDEAVQKIKKMRRPKLPLLSWKKETTAPVADADKTLDTEKENFHQTAADLSVDRNMEAMDDTEQPTEDCPTEMEDPQCSDLATASAVDEPTELLNKCKHSNELPPRSPRSVPRPILAKHKTCPMAATTSKMDTVEVQGREYGSSGGATASSYEFYFACEDSLCSTLADTIVTTTHSRHEMTPCAKPSSGLAKPSTLNHRTRAFTTNDIHKNHGAAITPSLSQEDVRLLGNRPRRRQPRGTPCTISVGTLVGQSTWLAAPPMISSWSHGMDFSDEHARHTFNDASVCSDACDFHSVGGIAAHAYPPTMIPHRLFSASNDTSSSVYGVPSSCDDCTPEFHSAALRANRLCEEHVLENNGFAVEKSRNRRQQRRNSFNCCLPIQREMTYVWKSLSAPYRRRQLKKEIAKVQLQRSSKGCLV